MASTQIVLGDITFAGMEVPESIPFGGEHSLVVHKLVGGDRVIDAMGRDDMPLEWSGVFLGDAALARARYLDTQRVLGKPLLLTWDELRYLVVIRSFTANYKFRSQIPYRMVCEVIADQGTPVTVVTVSSIDDLVDGDMDTATGLGGLIGDSTLSGLLGTLGTAISSVSSFASASQGTINSVMLPLSAVQGQVSTLIASTGNTIQNVGTVGGILPNTPVSQASANLAGQVFAFNRLPNLYALQSTVGRMAVNLGSVNGNTRQVPYAGGNLMDIAASQYGDTDAWTGIAKANGLSDPSFAGLKTITIPQRADNSGGVLGVPGS